MSSSRISTKLLLKGVEEEVYTGTRAGEIVPLSHRIVAELCGTATEPDARNVEYTTAPRRDYLSVGRALLQHRRRLRAYLADVGGLTIVPGAALSLGDTGRFYRSEPGNPYHEYIERTYGSNVVTTSEHLNIGMDAMPELFRAYRLLRLEGCLFLALSATSPFLDGQATGYHSIRWKIFPRTPPRVPLFADHQAYKEWIQAQLASRAMYNIRHLWLCVRPNGVGAPENLQRLELRICDSLEDLRSVLALIALLEARVWQSMQDADLDPLRCSSLAEEELIDLAAANEAAASRSSLDAELHHWRDGRSLSARQWIGSLLDETEPLANKHGFAEWLSPARTVLENGNGAHRWLARHQGGESVAAIIQAAIIEMEQLDEELVQIWGCGESTLAAPAGARQP